MAIQSLKTTNSASPQKRVNTNKSSQRPGGSLRLILIGFSALLSLIVFISTTLGPSVPADLDTHDHVGLSMVNIARYRGLHPNVVAIYNSRLRGNPVDRQEVLTKYIDALEVASKAARHAGLIAPSDTLLLSLTAAFQDGIPPESVDGLLSSSDDKIRLARLEKYHQARKGGLPPVSAATQAALIR